MFKTRILGSHFRGVRSFISTTAERKEITFSNAGNHLGVLCWGTKGLDFTQQKKKYPGSFLSKPSDI